MSIKLVLSSIAKNPPINHVRRSAMLSPKLACRVRLPAYDTAIYQAYRLAAFKA